MVDIPDSSGRESRLERSTTQALRRAGSPAVNAMDVRPAPQRATTSAARRLAPTVCSPNSHAAQRHHRADRRHRPRPSATPSHAPRPGLGGLGTRPRRRALPAKAWHPISRCSRWRGGPPFSRREGDLTSGGRPSAAPRRAGSARSQARASTRRGRPGRVDLQSTGRFSVTCEQP